MDVLIIGAGIGGLTLGLMLQKAGIPCRIYEAAPEIKPLGVGINLLPHAMKELSALGLEETLAARGVLTAEAVFFNRFGQLIYREPLGRAAGYDWPQISIHCGDLHLVLMEAFLPGVGDWNSVFLLRDLWHFHFTARRRSRWSPVASGFILSISGTISPPIPKNRYLKQIARFMRRPMRSQATWLPEWRSSGLFQRTPRISPALQRPS